MTAEVKSSRRAVFICTSLLILALGSVSNIFGFNALNSSSDGVLKFLQLGLRDIRLAYQSKSNTTLKVFKSNISATETNDTGRKMQESIEKDTALPDRKSKLVFPSKIFAARRRMVDIPSRGNDKEVQDFLERENRPVFGSKGDNRLAGTRTIYAEQEEYDCNAKPTVVAQARRPPKASPSIARTTLVPLNSEPSDESSIDGDYEYDPEKDDYYEIESSSYSESRDSPYDYSVSYSKDEVSNPRGNGNNQSRTKTKTMVKVRTQQKVRVKNKAKVKVRTKTKVRVKNQQVVKVRTQQKYKTNYQTKVRVKNGTQKVKTNYKTKVKTNYKVGTGNRYTETSKRVSGTKYTTRVGYRSGRGEG
ncbi:MAG: hypothetical protein SGBAC_008822, partial [Bacillariaceae sp.]